MRTYAVLAAAMLAGCGDALVGATYPGEPLAAVSGSMIPTPETELDGPVRLALAWYPQWLAAEQPGGGDLPPAIVTEDVEARGTFPVDFSFPIYRPPPREALAPLDGLAGRGAFGVLLAYRDLDGDRRLSPIPARGAPVDRVIGSSLLGDPRTTFALLYVDSPQPAETGLRPGLNLVMAVNEEDAEVVPLSTRVRLALTAGGPIYDAFVCEAGWLAFLFTDVCGLPAGGEEGPPGFGFAGSVTLDGDRLQVELRVTSDGVPAYPEANVNVNGRVIPWDPAAAEGQGAFVLVEDATTLVRPGSSFVVSVAAAGVSRGAVFAIPGEFSILTPGEGATVTASEPLLLSWTAAPGADEYYAGFSAPPAGFASITDPPGTLSLLLDTTWAGVGAATSFVEARDWGDDASTFVTTALVRRRGFWFSE